MIVREDIYQALFDHVVSLVPSLVTYSRLLRHWAEVPAAERPALFQAQGHEQAIQSTGKPTVWIFETKLYLYVSTDGQTPPSTLTNPIMDTLANSLANPFAGGIPQTLGGLVQWARIEGQTETDEGTLGNDAVVRIPVRMMVV
jgi:hypothetical protein